LNLARNKDGVLKVGYSRYMFCGPNRVYLVLATNSDASRIDEKIECLVTKKIHPFEPLNIGSSTGGPYWLRWQALG
jgi:hypothetical protein